MQSYNVVAACAGYTRNAVTAKTLTLISGAPDTRAQHSLLTVRVVTVEKEKLETVLVLLSREHALCWRWLRAGCCNTMQM